jgi:hypothetical protein
VVATSTDGGTIWERAPLPVSRCAGAGARQVRFASDPWVSVGPDGRIYVSTLSDVVSVLTSTDWGAHWSPAATVRGRYLSDKPTITADPRRPGTAYLTWSDYLPTRPPGTESDEVVSITHDGGRSWSTPRVVLGHGSARGPEDGQVLVDSRTGRLYVLMAWVVNGFIRPGQPGAMMISSSDDGGVHWSRARTFAAAYAAPQPRNQVIRSSPQIPSFAIDREGTLFATWQDARFSRGARDEVLFMRSADGGAHWSTPRRLSVPTSGRAIIPTIAAGAAGSLAVIYLQVDKGPALEARYRIATSADRGRTFHDAVASSRFAITGVPNLTSSPLVPGGYFVGDYMGITPVGGRFGAVYIAATGGSGRKTDAFFTTEPVHR